MTKEAFVLENKNGEISRYIDWKGESLQVVQLKNSKRVLFLNSTSQLDKEEAEYTVLDKLSKADVRRKPQTIKEVGVLKLFEADSRLVKEVVPTPEDEQRLKTYFGYSFIGSVGILAVVLISSFIINKFIDKKVEPVVVQVFQQDREFKPEQKRTVEVSQKKVQPRQQVRNAKISNHTRIVKNSTSRPVKVAKNLGTRSGNGLGNVGALSVLGGYSKKFHGSGGLNLNAKSNNAGIGMGGPAMRGGHERGLLGKGLVSAGIGDGSSLQGYGGTGAKGLGGGKPGYGNQRMAGQSGSYFEPLSEESLIEGGLDQDQINAVIQRNIGQIIYCYEQGLQTQPGLAGRVAVKFVIAGSGAVSSANIANTSLSSKKVESCIVGKLKGWKFPTPVGRVNVRVTYPFLLKRLSQG